MYIFNVLIIKLYLLNYVYYLNIIDICRGLIITIHNMLIVVGLFHSSYRLRNFVKESRDSDVYIRFSALATNFRATNYNRYRHVTCEPYIYVYIRIYTYMYDVHCTYT